MVKAGLDDLTQFEVTEAMVGGRVDAVVAAQAPAWVSRSRIKALVKTGHVSVNGVVCLEPNKRLQSGDHVAWMVPEPEDPTPLGEDIPLDIVFEDEHLIVINKPPRMVVHPAAGNWTGTLVNALIHHCGEGLSGVGGVRRPGIVHRLDKDTSGLLVVAKSDEAHQGLAAQFADHGRSGPLVRSYQALVWNALPLPKGVVETFLGRDKHNRLKRAVVAQGAPDAKWAVTHYRRQHEEHLGDEKHPLVLTLVDCRLETGRTHQIRVHMAHLGCPLVGDAVYGSQFQTRANRLPDDRRKLFGKFRRQALHAQSLGFEHPVTKKPHLFEANLPDDMQRLLKS